MYRFGLAYIQSGELCGLCLLQILRKPLVKASYGRAQFISPPEQRVFEQGKRHFNILRMGADKYLSRIGVGQPFPLVLEKESDRFDKVKEQQQRFAGIGYILRQVYQCGIRIDNTDVLQRGNHAF